jgi:hypothetical protein
MTGIGLCGGLSLVLVLGKLLGLWGGSWWWMVLPLLVFVVCNVLYIGMGFLYLTLEPVKDRPAEEESALQGGYRDGVSYGSGVVCVVGLVINVLSRLEGVDASDRWWVFSGRGVVLVVFGVLSAISFWLYWSGIGDVLGHEDDDGARC